MFFSFWEVGQTENISETSCIKQTFILRYLVKLLFGYIHLKGKFINSQFMIFVPYQMFVQLENLDESGRLKLSPTTRINTGS